jgi:transcriptional regulator with PAS, ATPase and Fis domain
MYCIHHYFLGTQLTTVEREIATLAYHWPGNIRELANVIERALILSPGSTLIVDETQMRVCRWLQTSRPLSSLRRSSVPIS